MMPILAGLIISIASNLASFLGLFFAKKIAIGAAVVSTLAVLVVALYASLSGLISGLAVGFPSWPGVSIGIWVATPFPVAQGLTAMIATDAAIALFKWNAENVKLLAQAS